MRNHWLKTRIQKTNTHYRGKFQEADTLNKEGRLYPQEVLEAALEAPKEMYSEEIVSGGIPLTTNSGHTFVMGVDTCNVDDSGNVEIVVTVTDYQDSSGIRTMADAIAKELNDQAWFELESHFVGV